MVCVRVGDQPGLAVAAPTAMPLGITSALGVTAEALETMVALIWSNTGTLVQPDLIEQQGRTPRPNLKAATLRIASAGVASS